jgi:hypothetical protein
MNKLELPIRLKTNGSRGKEMLSKRDIEISLEDERRAAEDFVETNIEEELKPCWG